MSSAGEKGKDWTLTWGLGAFTRQSKLANMKEDFWYRDISLGLEPF
jgi:hypothetical protein